MSPNEFFVALIITHDYAWELAADSSPVLLDVIDKLVNIVIVQ